MTVLSDISLPQINVLGSTIAYREAGDREAPVALFLHGNPTSSYARQNTHRRAQAIRVLYGTNGSSWRAIENFV